MRAADHQCGPDHGRSGAIDPQSRDPTDGDRDVGREEDPDRQDTVLGGRRQGQHRHVVRSPALTADGVVASSETSRFRVSGMATA